LEAIISLNIKNGETCILARDLAGLTKETMTGAITVALRERLERQRRNKNAVSGVTHLIATGRRMA